MILHVRVLSIFANPKRAVDSDAKRTILRSTDAFNPFPADH
jgi:hypothetical protein